jgi:hypothetical protein
MSEREIRRIEVLSEVMSGRRTLVAAAAVLAVTPRHARRLLLRLQAGGGTTLAHKARGRHHELTVSRETLRQRMAEAGPWLSRQQRRSFHQPRLRREACGELVQIDDSEHRWFQDRGDPCTLLVFIDDTTGKLMQLRFVVQCADKCHGEENHDQQGNKCHRGRHPAPTS